LAGGNALGTYLGDYTHLAGFIDGQPEEIIFTLFSASDVYKRESADLKRRKH
jgi:hypothetical protein